MSAVTYSDDEVAGFFNQHLVPIQIKVDQAGDLGERFGLRWTPHLLVISPRERVLRMATGWFSPSELIPWAIMGMALGLLFQKDWHLVRERCQWVLKDYPQSFAAPEAVYYQGVAGMRSDHNVQHLKGILATLQKDYPGSEWAMRAWPYSKL